MLSKRSVTTSRKVPVFSLQQPRPDRCSIQKISVRFMQARDEELGGKGNADAEVILSTMSQHARDTLGWLRHAFQDPDDFSASAIGRMVSKEYGRHERPHTEHHMWRSPAGSPTAQQAAAAAEVRPEGHNPQQATAQQQQQQQHSTGWGWGWGGPASSDPEVYHSPPSGPGFLLQQQQQQQRHD